MQPAEDLLKRIYGLWDELADFESGACDAAVMHLLSVLAGMISAQNAYWLGTVRLSADETDPLRGWRPRVIQYLHPREIDEAFARRAIRGISRGESNESTIAHARQAGHFRAYTVRDIVPPGWFESAANEDAIERRGIADKLYVIFPVNDVTECYYGFHRIAPAGRFTPEERDLAAFAIRGLKWFHRQLLLNHGLLVARSPLAPTERRVLQLLLSDMSEKEIGKKLGLTLATTHTYITDILRKFGVSGRPGLTALWLGKTR